MADQRSLNRSNPQKRPYDYDLSYEDPSADYPSSSSPYFGSQPKKSRTPTYDISPRPPYMENNPHSSTKKPGRGLSYEEEEIKFLLYALYQQMDSNAMFHAFKLKFPGTTRNKASLVVKMKELKLKLYDRLAQKDTDLDYDDEEPKVDHKDEAWEFLRPDTISNGTTTYFCFYKKQYSEIKVGISNQTVRFMITKLAPDFPLPDEGERDFYQTKAVNKITLDYHLPSRIKILKIVDTTDIKGVEIEELLTSPARSSGFVMS